MSDMTNSVLNYLKRQPSRKSTVGDARGPVNRIRCCSKLGPGLMILVSSLVVGCSTHRATIVNYTQGGLGTCLHFDYKNQENKDFYLAKYREAKDDNTPQSEKATVRNSILFELMGLVDAEYYKFEMKLRSDRALKDTIVKVVSLSLTGTATLSGESAANILAAVDTGLKGSNEAWDKNMLGDKACELLNNTMRAERSKIEAEIYVGMKKAVTGYPLEAGIRDVVRYYRQGFVTAALTTLMQSSAADAKNSADAAKGVK